MSSSLAAVSVVSAPASMFAASTQAAVVTPGQYAWAVATARARSSVSAGVLVKSIKVSTAQSVTLMARLHAKGITSAPAASGAARVLAPLFRTSAFMSSAAKAAPIQPSADGLKSIAKKMDHWTQEAEMPEPSEDQSND